jgi:hypothetical protein
VSAALDESDARGLAAMEPPAWTLLTLPLSRLTSTSLRGKDVEPALAKTRKAAKTAKKEAKKAEKAAKRRFKKEAKQPEKAAKSRGKKDTNRQA